MSDFAARALLIGNWEYTDPDKRLGVLKGPENDLDVLRGALTDPDYGLFKDKDVIVKENLPSKEMENALYDFVNSGQRRVNQLIYFSGHGERLSRERLGLCGVDVTHARLELDAFDLDDLRHWIQEYQRENNTIIILDCCYASRWKSAGTDLSFGQGTAVLSSGNEPAPDAQREDTASPFTAALAELLTSASLTPRDGGGFLGVDDLYRAITRYEPKLLPAPRFRLETDGSIPLARRPPHETPAVGELDAAPADPPTVLRGYRPDLSFTTLELAFTDTGCIADGTAHDTAALDPNRQAAVRRLSSLADALMRTKEYANQHWWRRAVGKAWQTVGANLFESAVPKAAQDRIVTRTSDTGGEVLKVQLRFEGEAARLLEPYPWEYLQVGRGPSTVPAEGDAPIGDLPLPLALRPGLIVERVSHGRPNRTTRGNATPHTTKTAVGLVNVLPEPMDQLARRTATELRAMTSVDLLFELTGPAATWLKLVDSLELNRPRHLVLFVPVNRDGRPARLGFFDDRRDTAGPDREPDWRPAERLVDLIRSQQLTLESLLLITFAAAPGRDTVRGVLELARDFEDLGVGPVVFGCHWPGYERSVLGFETTEPETFPGLFLQAMSLGEPLDRSVYYARHRVMQRSRPEVEVLFGVPGYYGVRSTGDEPERAAEAGAGGGLPGVTSAGVVTSRER